MDTYAPRSECCWVDVDSGSLTINPQLDPGLLFISMLALVMLPQAAAQGWHKAQPGIRPDSKQIEGHAGALLMAGLAATTPITPVKAIP